MGTYTSGKYSFFKPDPQEFCDPKVDMQNNMNIIDDRIFRMLKYKVSDAISVDKTKVEEGFKVYDQRLGKLVYYTSTTSRYIDIPKDNPSAWTYIGFGAIPAFENIGGSSLSLTGCAWRYIDIAQTQVEIKGRFAPVSGTFTNNTSVALTTAGAVPNAAISTFKSVPPGMGPGNPSGNIAGRVEITPTGQINYIHYGTNNTDVSNYGVLDGIFYSTI